MIRVGSITVELSTPVTLVIKIINTASNYGIA